jgi:micrococcal nuclease
MDNFWKKIFWILFFLLLIFCCWFYFSTKFERPAADVAVPSGSGLLDPVPFSQMPSVVERKENTQSATATSAVERLFVVDRVIDGDTIVVLMNGEDETVRLLGMDTPETVDPRKPVQCFGPEASAETKSLLDGREVSLQNDPTQSDRDKYGRLLRYVFRDDGLFVDEFLVQQGFAREYTYFGVPYKYQTIFRTDQAAAKSAGLGLWATSTCDGKR